MELAQIEEALKAHDLELVIGLETHVRLNTKTKLFCSCPNQEIDIPNEHICSVCTGQMGVLPSLNKEAITKAIYFGKAVKSTFSNEPPRCVAPSPAWRVQCLRFLPPDGGTKQANSK